MSIRKLIYVSDAAQPFDEDAVITLATEATRRNAAAKVTGILTMRNGTFLQYLEGPVENLERVWQRISNDPRHVVRRTVDYEVPDHQRLFPDWHMRYLSMQDPKADTTLVLEQLFRNVEIPDSEVAHNTLETFAEKLAEDFA